MSPKVRCLILLAIVYLKTDYIIAQGPQLTPSGITLSCETENLTFTCTPQSKMSSSAWILNGFNGVTPNVPVGAGALSGLYPNKISTSDVDRDVHPSNLTILNLMPSDIQTQATIQCEDKNRIRSTETRVTFGPPYCNINATKEDVAVDSIAVSWVVSNCTAEPTDYEVTWSEVGSELQTSSSGKITSNSFTIDNLMPCRNYVITVLLFNECGVGSNISAFCDAEPGNVSIHEADTCSFFPIGLRVVVTRHYTRCPVKELLFSANGTSLPSQLYNPDPTFIYRTVSGSAGEVYNHTVTAIYTETVNMSSDPLSVRVKEGFEGVQHDASETSITFTCSTSCLGPFSGELACNITLPDYNRSSMKNFSRENVNVTIPDLSSETDYEYNASIFLNGIIVRSIVQNARTLAIDMPSTEGPSGMPSWIPAVIVIVILAIIAIVILLILLCYFMYKKYNKTHPKAERSNRENKPLKVSDALYAQTGPDTGGSHSGGGDPGLYSYAATETAFGAQVRKQEEASKVQPKKDTTDGASSPSHVAGPQGDLYAQPDKPTKGSRKEKDVKHVAAPATGDLYAMPEKGKPQVQHEKGPITGEEYAVAARKKDNLPILP